MFAFAPVSVATPEGTVGVQITGSFAIQGGPPGDRLVFADQPAPVLFVDDSPTARSRTRGGGSWQDRATDARAG